MEKKHIPEFFNQQDTY